MLRLSALKNYFLSPIFPDDELKTRRARLLSATFNTLIVVVGLIMVGNVLGGRTPPLVLYINALFIVICTALRSGLRRGYLDATAFVLIVVSFIAVTFGSASLGTIRTPTTSLYLVIIMYVGLVFESRLLLTTCVILFSTTVLGLFLAETSGRLPEPDLAVTITQWITFTGIFIMVASLIHYALYMIRTSLKKAKAALLAQQQAEAKLRVQEEALRAITDNMQDMIVRVDPQGVIQYANPAYYQSLGYKAENVIGETSFDFMHPDDGYIMRYQFESLARGSDFGNLVEFRYRHADGRYLYIEATGQVLRDDDQLVGVVSVFRDITSRRQAENRIRQLSQAVEASPAAISIMDADGSIEYVNPMFTTMTGYTLEDVKGQNFGMLKAAADDAPTFEQITQTLLEGKVWRGELHNRRKDGEQYWEKSVISPITDAGGHITHYVAVEDDINAQKLMELNTYRRNIALSGLYNTTVDILKHLSVEDLMEVVLQRACQLLDASFGSIFVLEGEELVTYATTVPFGTIKVGDRFHQEMAKLSWKAIMTKEPAILDNYSEWALRRKAHDQHNIQAVANFPMVRGDRCLGILGLSRIDPDYPFHTEQVQTGRLLAQLAALAIDNAQLYTLAQSELQERQKAENSLRVSNVELKKQNEELDAFAHTVAHDLKNPIGSIMGYADLILEYRDQLSTHEAQTFLQAIVRGSNKANDIINALLQLARVRKQRVSPEPLQMRNILNEVLQRLESAIQKAEGQVNIQAPENWPEALGYGPWVEEIWVNYIGNALKYAGPNPCIELSAYCEDGNLIRFNVRDHGRGLTTEERERLFTPFERLEQTTEDGHGLGLSIVRRIAEKLGGRVGVESVLGEGSIFYFELPAAADATAANASPSTGQLQHPR